MRRQWLTAAGLAIGMLAGMLAAPAPASQTQPGYDIERRSYVVETKHGHIYVEIAHPVEGGKVVQGPVIFTYSPYSILGVPPNYRRNRDAARWVPRGYHRAWADVVGTGNSGGCFDYGGKRERDTGKALVEWLAKQKWSTGKVGMIGGSYEGTTATAAAIEDPKGLVTIVPEAAISRWYEYAYSGGVRYFWNDEAIGNQGPGAATDEGFDTPAAFDFGLAIPPPLDVSDPTWAQRMQSTMTPCDEIEHTQRGYDDTPDYDKFWKERDYILGANNIDIPVLISHNWGDYNVKQEEAWNLYQAIKRSPKKVLYMGSRWEGHSTPGGDYAKRVDAWMDHYLMGKDNGIENLPPVISRVSDQQGDVAWYEGPEPKTRNIKLVAQETVITNPDDYQWKLLPQQPRAVGKDPSPASFPGMGINTETHANHHSRFNHDWFWFESPPLAKDTRVFGTPKIQIYSTVDRTWVTFAVGVVDLDHSRMYMAAGQHIGPHSPNQLLSATRAFHDSRYRDSLAKAKPVKPGKTFGMTLTAKPIDYVFRKHHTVALNISTEMLEWMVPKPYPCDTPDCPHVRLNWEEGRLQLVLPVVNAPRNAMNMFDMRGGHHQE